MPEMVEQGLDLSPGAEAFFAVSPSAMRAHPDILGFHVEKRGCLLDGERRLRHFRHYNFPNCVAECAANRTMGVGNEVAFSRKNIQNLSPTCVAAARRTTCPLLARMPGGEGAARASAEVRNSPAFSSPSSLSSGCGCLPPCADLEFLPENLRDF